MPTTPADLTGKPRAWGLEEFAFLSRADTLAFLYLATQIIVIGDEQSMPIIVRQV
jgi:hypothetical protein